MTSPRSTYGGGYYASSSFVDTPIYDSLVAERGTPQIAPIRVSSPYDVGSSLPALPSALPALPAEPSPQGPAQQSGYAPGGPSAAPLQPAAAPYIPQQSATPRGYPGQYQQQPQQPQQQPQQPQRPPTGTGYDAMRPAAPMPQRPAPAPAPYDDPYGRPYPGRGY